MKDYAQYSSRIPSPSSKRFGSNKQSGPNGSSMESGTSSGIKTSSKAATKSAVKSPATSTIASPLAGTKATRNGAVHPQNSPHHDKRERESTSTASSNGTQRQSPQQDSNSVTQQQNFVSTPPPTSSTSTALNATDALSLRQNGIEPTVSKLRQALDDANSRDATAKAALAKSDAIILELRTTVRNLKRQLESIQIDSKHTTQDQKTRSDQQIHQLQTQISQLQHQLALSQNSTSKDSKVGELQVQLDRAHAQILTADMVRKELEDTLEAEQYTWELRVQDQERQIADLNEECDRLQSDLNDARSQWKEAEQGWNRQVEELQQQLTQARTRMATTQAASVSGLSSSKQDDMSPASFLQKINQLETERAELQNCLDEALLELEAVDVELQTEGKSSKSTPAEIVESMQNLLRWVHQEGPSTSVIQQNLTRDPKRLLREIQHALEGWLRTIQANKQVTNSIGKTSQTSQLESQILQYQEELKSREESSAELRESLKEAVALLKPLQDAVAKAESEKQLLHDKLKETEIAAKIANRKLSEAEQQLSTMKADMDHLEQQVEEQRSIATARGNLLTDTSVNSSTSRKAPEEYNGDSLLKIQRAREELRRKRETEGNLQQLLKDAQSRFHSLHQQNEDVAARNRELQGKLQEAETQIGNPPSPPSQDQLTHVRQLLQDREVQVAELQKALQQAGQGNMQLLNNQLHEARQQLASKEQTEVALNKSLRDALGLLKPLQLHLEEAEREKMEISKELRNLRKRFRQLQMGELPDDQSKSTLGGGQDVSVELIKIKDELEETVRQLELENSQLQDALDDMSENGTAETRLRQKLVELNSRYEVTQAKLEDAHVESHALVQSLKQKEQEELQMVEELQHLRQSLASKESELQNAKAIARSALVKVEELTMTNIEQLSLSRDGSIEMNFPLSGH